MSHALFGYGRLNHVTPAFLMRRGVWGIADQALVSASNFILMILVARQIGPSAFGVFIIAYTLMLFASSLQSALFTQPHNFLGPRRQGHEYACYTTATTIAQALFALCACVIIAGAGVILLAKEANIGWTIVLLGPTCMAWQLQEFARRVLYTQSDYPRAFSNDVVTYGGQLVAISLLWSSGQIRAESAIAAIGISSGLGALLGGWQLRHLFIPNLDVSSIRNHACENWTFSKWLLGSSLAAWTSSQLYLILTAGFVSAGAAGGLRATLNLIAPTHVVLKTMESMLPSRSASAYHSSGLWGLRKTIRRFAVPTGLVISGYCLVVSFFAKPMLGWLLGSSYEPYWWLVPMMSVVYVLGMSSAIASIFLSCVGKMSAMFYANAGSSVIVLTFGIWTVSQLGLIGTAIGMIVHGVFLNVALWWFALREMRR